MGKSRYCKQVNSADEVLRTSITSNRTCSSCGGHDRDGRDDRGDRRDDRGACRACRACRSSCVRSHQLHLLSHHHLTQRSLGLGFRSR